ncbi:MAG: DMT family transporter [Acidobacteriota bacterium]|nr:DMT family transporter [Acidobacteriota bacterium]
MPGDWLLLVVPGLIWGASFLFIAEGLRALGPSGVAFIRICAGFLTLALFPRAHRRVERGDWAAVAWLGVLWFAFPLTLFPYAEQRVSSALTGMLNGANPLFATMVASYMAKRLPSRGVLAGLAVGIAGAALMAVPALGAGHSSAMGVVLILVALTSYGLALNIAHGLQAKYGGVPVIWRAQGIGILLTAPAGLHDVAGAQWSLVPVLSLIALGAFGTGIAYVVLAAAAGRFGAVRASGTTFLIPVVALVLGMSILHEHVALLSAIGGLVCLAGAWLMKHAAHS